MRNLTTSLIALSLLTVTGRSNSAQAQAATLIPPTFTWGTAYNVVSGITGASLIGNPAATVTPTGEVWVNVADSVISRLYNGMARQRLERYHPNGALALRRHLTGRSLVRHLRAGANGRLYLVGYYEQSLTLAPGTTLTTADNDPHDFLACLDSAGAVVYALDLTTTLGQGYNATDAVLPAPNDHVYLGFSRGVVGQPNTLIQELDARGTVVRTLTQTGGMSISSLAQDAQGTLFVTGSCMRAAGGSFNGTQLVPGVSGNGYNQYVACYEPSGTLRWARFMGDFTCVEPKLSADGAGGVYWLTKLTGQAEFGGVTMPGPATGSTEDFLLARLDAAGSVQWVRDVPTTQQDDAGMGWSSSLDTDAAGNLYMVGQTRGSIQWASGVQTNAGTTRDLLVLRVSPGGVVEWARTAPGAMGYVSGSTIAVAPDGSVVVTGIGNGAMTFDNITLPTVSRNHFFVARLTPGGPTAVPESTTPAAWHLVPNPAAARVTLQAPKGAGRISAEVFDALGRRVLHAADEAGALSLDVRALAAGLYTVRATSAAGSWTGRLVKE